MPSRKESGLLVLLDEGYFQRLDNETDIRRAALQAAGAKAWKVPRTQVVRDLLRFALDAHAHARGEVVPVAVPVAVEELEPFVSPLDEPCSALAPGMNNESGEEEPDPPIEWPPPVTVGRVSGGRGRMIGVRGGR